MNKILESIVAGGWIAVLIILIIVILATVLCSAYAIFVPVEEEFTAQQNPMLRMLLSSGNAKLCVGEPRQMLQSILKNLSKNDIIEHN